MNWIVAVLKTAGPRILGTVASGLAGWIYTKTKGIVTVDPETLVTVGTAMIAGYSLTHRATSSFINPGDAAKGRVSDAIKAASDSPLNEAVVIPPSKP